MHQKVNLLNTLVIILPLIYLILAPYTKVEESFNLQAIHDLIFYGIKGLEKFDHIEFPGVVPRTFVGSLIISQIVKRIVKSTLYIIDFITGRQFPKSTLRLVYLFTAINLARYILGSLSSFSILTIGNSLRKNFGLEYQKWFLLYSIVQFHFMFWCSRTLPNTFALILVNFGISIWIRNIGIKEKQIDSKSKNDNQEDKNDNIKVKQDVYFNKEKSIYFFISIMLPSALIFRSETFFLMSFLILSELLKYVSFYLNLKRLINFILFSILILVLSLAITVIVDSYFWKGSIFINGKWIWPEGYVFYFNAVMNKSKEWGVSPFNYYFINSLPKISGISYIMNLVSLIIFVFIRPASKDKKSIEERILLITNSKCTLPSFAYVLFMSFHGHKEWRFISYIIPLFNISAACTTVYIFSRFKIRNQRLYITILKFLLSWSLAISLTISILLGLISSLNYPGGEALYMLSNINNQVYNKFKEDNIKVHLDVATAMNGASRFLQLEDKWIYDKKEDLNSASDFLIYNYLLTYNPKMHLEASYLVSDLTNPSWEVIGVAYGLNTVHLSSPKVWIDKLITTNPMQLIRETLDKELGEPTYKNHNFNKFRKQGLKLIEHFTPLKIEYVPKCYILRRVY